MKMRSRGWLWSGVMAALLCSAAQAQQMHLPWQTGNQGNGPQQSVEYLYPLQLEVPAGKPVEVDLHFRVLGGLHINSHHPSDRSFIPTTLITPDGPNLKVASVVFPPGEAFALKAFPNDKLSVYTGDFTVRMKLTATRGDHLLQASLRYQACDTNSCYPPRKAPVAVDVIGK